MAVALVAGLGAAEAQETGRGLISTEGPSGLFINPSSGTLPKGGYTAQYCAFFPENKTDIVGHGYMGAYGISENLELGVIGTIIDLPEGLDTLNGIGPFGRYRLLRQQEMRPELSVGVYTKFGDTGVESYSGFAAAFWQKQLSPSAALRSIGFHAGLRNSWFDDENPTDRTFASYFGAELELPLRVYLVGEVMTKPTSSPKAPKGKVPYALGAQWRAAGFAISLAAIQNGGLEDPSFYFGVGFGGGAKAGQ